MKTITNLASFHFLTVNHKQKTKIETNGIIMMEGHNNYTLIYLQNGKKKLYARTLSHFAEQLGEKPFIRCHRAFLVNPDFITGYDKEANKLLLQNNLEARISRRKQGNLDVFLSKNQTAKFMSVIQN
jgi:DNA-binding LytR/AlgR family response regulator